MTVLRFLPIKEVTQLGKWNYLMLKNFASRARLNALNSLKKTTLNERAERSEAPASLINFVNLIKSNEVSKCKWKDQINLACVCNKCLKLGNKNCNFVTLSTVVLSTLINTIQ